MEYRTIEQLGIKTSLLGFGCMRFPVLEDGTIQEEEAEKMLDTAIKNGVNYIDTAYPYHNGGSEPFLGRVLKKYDRSTYYLATKLPCWEVHSLEDAKRLFESQLKRLDQKYLDFYLLHSLNQESWNSMKELGVVSYCEQLKAEGKIKYLGFSFHDEYEVFEEILTCRNWDFCQIQLNYMDMEYQAGIRGYQLTEKLHIPLIIMEPVKGGALASFPKDLMDIFHSAAPDKSAASFALRFVGSLPNVKVILSGMSTPKQVADNLSTFEAFQPLSEKEQQAIKEVRETLNRRVKNGCTGCRYCMPCPAGVNIPASFKVWNTYHTYQSPDFIRWQWEQEMDGRQKPKYCIECGKCEKACPQHLSIREDLKKVQAEMDAALAK